MQMHFDIVPGSPVPIYRQIVEQLRRQVAGGQCQPGDELPSVRALALQHAINPMTVSKAYSLLEAEGLLERRRGVGMAVAATRHRTDAPTPTQLLRPTLREAAQQARELGLDASTALSLFAQCLQDAMPDERQDPGSPSA
ncbi:GntR family transcriptional regulator [Ideonella sp. DXS22W]|uniref:GntR family transcriptional regulator n=1 Tax=Pseudaquabacterium inlustre TaxID=2984192 RepID=A0ABU9CDG1_9BURK